MPRQRNGDGKRIRNDSGARYRDADCCCDDTYTGCGDCSDASLPINAEVTITQEASPPLDFSGTYLLDTPVSPFDCLYSYSGTVDDPGSAYDGADIDIGVQVVDAQIDCRIQISTVFGTVFQTWSHTNTGSETCEDMMTSSHTDGPRSMGIYSTSVTVQWG